jgi:hypothetical protein
MNEPIRLALRFALRHSGVPAALIAIALALTGCHAARMPVPESLVSAERMAVSGRQGMKLNQELRFGSYRVHPIKRSWTRGRDRGSMPVASQSERSQSFELTIGEDETAFAFVACRASAESVRIDLGVVEMNPADRSALYCNIQSTTDRLVAWEMELQERRARPLAGTITGGPSRFHVVGTNRLERGLPVDVTTGYELRDGDRVVAAVEVVNGGAVWLSPDLEPGPRRVMAAAAAALLVLEDLYDTIR